MTHIDLIMPSMGESVAEATVIKWLKDIGDKIEIDDTVVEIATDKVDSEIPSEVEGILVKKLFNENDIIKVGEAIAVIEVAGSGEKVMLEEEDNTSKTNDKAELLIEKAGDALSSLKARKSKANNRFISPLVKKIVAEENISKEELDSIVGTGKDDRVTKNDIIAYIENKKNGVEEKKEKITEEQDNFNVAYVEEKQPTIPPEVSTPPKAEYTPPVAQRQSYERVAERQPISQPEVSTPPKAEYTPPVAQQQSYERVAERQPISQPEVSTPPKVKHTPPVAQRQSYERVEEKQPISQPEAPTPPKVEYTPPVAQRQSYERVEEEIYKKEEPAKVNKVENHLLNVNDEVMEMDRMRKLIANHMVMSKKVAPHVTSFVEVDVTKIVHWRNKVKDGFLKREGVKITYTPIFIEAVVKAINDFPMINISVNGDKIIKHRDVNIGVATALPSGNLIVPVIKEANFKNLLGLTKNVATLVGKARANKLLPDDISGGTYTITNIGTFGNILGTPIINQPQVAILAIGAIRKVPAVVETPDGDVIAVRHKMYLSHAYDHRVVDGALGGMFVKRVAEYLEAFDMDREV